MPSIVSGIVHPGRLTTDGDLLPQDMAYRQKGSNRQKRRSRSENIRPRYGQQKTTSVGFLDTGTKKRDG